MNKTETAKVIKELEWIKWACESSNAEYKHNSFINMISSMSRNTLDRLNNLEDKRT